MSDYPYNLSAIASHLRDLSKELAKLLDISHEDAWDLCIDKLYNKYSQIKKKESNDRIKNTLFNSDVMDKETND
tara:strand:+ start:363 stop:584 length:222 start_codon:yes stop_codon:yes gene_type:complete